jgi:single-strand DNA-binding protein
MAFTRNNVEILGNVGKDPEVRTTTGGTLIATLAVATSERYPDKSSSGIIENTEWHSVVAFERQAEIIRDYVKKGSKVMVIGKLKTRSWDDKPSGKKMYRTEIIVERIGLLDGKTAADGRGAGNKRGGADANQVEDSTTAGEYEDVPLESVPF